MKCSNRISGMQESPIRKLVPYANAARANGKKVYPLNIGQPDIKTPEGYFDAIKNFKQEVLEYADSHGDFTLIDEISKYYARNNMDFAPEDILITNGGSEALMFAMIAICDPGESVVVVEPFYTNYNGFASAVSVNCEGIITKAEKGYRLPSKEEILSRISHKARAIIITNPSKHTGVVYTKETIEKMCDLLRKKEKEYGHSIFVITDEPYRELVYDDIEVPYIINYYHNTFVCYSYSKALSLPGERIGYIAVSPDMDDEEDAYAAVCGAGRALGYVCASSMYQRVIEKCLDATSDISIYKTNRDLLYNSLTGMGYECVYPDGAFYLFVKAMCDDSHEFCEKAKEHELLLVPADSFGTPGYIRVSYCVQTKQIEDALPAFKKLAEEYE